MATNETSDNFNGVAFYNLYKDADFLRVDADVERFLSHGYEIRQTMKSVKDGESHEFEDIKVARNTPLKITKSGKSTKLGEFEFTVSRFQGLVAAYVYENRHRFPVLEAGEPKALGLVWDNENEEKCKLYLSAITGSNKMIDQFSYFPLLCALRKFQLEKLPVQLVLGTGSVKNSKGIPMSQILKQNIIQAKRLWLNFPGGSFRDVDTVINGTPEITKMFQG